MTLTIVAIVLATLSTVSVIAIAVLMRPGREDPPGITRVVGKVDEFEQILARHQGIFDYGLQQLDSKVVGLQKTVDQREGALGAQVSQLDSHVSSIAGIFSSDRARGGWGEISLRRILESLGLVVGRDFDMQVGAPEGIPDAIVMLPGDRKIVIDAKFPIARFNDALEESDPERRNKAMKAHAKQIEKVAESLNRKDYANIASGGYVVMYLPSQAVWEAAVAADNELVTRLAKQRVFVAGPLSLPALLLPAAQILAEHRFVDEAQAVLADAHELHKRLAKFAGFFQGIGTNLDRAVKAFNFAVGSWTGRLTPQVNKMAERAGLDQLSDITPVERTLRDFGDNALDVAS